MKKYVVTAIRSVPLSCPVMTNPEYMDSVMPVGTAVQDERGDIEITLDRPVENTTLWLRPPWGS